MSHGFVGELWVKKKDRNHSQEITLSFEHIVFHQIIVEDTLERVCWKEKTEKEKKKNSQIKQWKLPSEISDTNQPDPQLTMAKLMVKFKDDNKEFRIKKTKEKKRKEKHMKVLVQQAKAYVLKNFK